MRNKKFDLRFTATLAAFTIFASALVGCGSGEKVVDASALAAQLVGEIEYDDELSELDADAASMYMTIADGVDVVLYMGSGSTAEEVAVFTAPDEETAEEQYGYVKKFLSSQEDSYRSYLPEEAKRIEDAILTQEGNYVVLCVSSDSDAAQQIISKAFK